MTETVALSDVALSLQDGPFGSNLKRSHYVDQGVRVVRLQNIGVGYFDDRDQAFVSEDHFGRLTKHECRAGDVLIATLGDPIIRACVQPAWLEIALNKADCLRLRCDPKRVVPEYVVHFLNSGATLAQAKSLAHGQTRPRVNLSQVRTLKVPLPPLAEQRRIARLLDALQRITALRTEFVARVDALVDAQFRALFGDPDTNPLGWELKPLSGFVLAFEGGRSFAGSDDGDAGAPYRVLRVSAVTSGSFRPEESRPVPRTYSPPPRHRVRQGDLLISRANTSELVGAVALVDRVADGLLLPDKIWRFVWRDAGAAVPEFVWQLFRTRAVRAAVSRRATGTSGSMKNISAEKLMGIEVIQPPLERQRQFAQLLHQTHKLRARAGEHLERLNELFASLEQGAFDSVL